MHELSRIRHLDSLIVTNDLTVNAFESDPYDAIYYTYYGKIIGLELVGNYQKRFKDLRNTPEESIKILDDILANKKVIN